LTESIEVLPTDFKVEMDKVGRHHGCRMKKDGVAHALEDHVAVNTTIMNHTDTDISVITVLMDNLDHKVLVNFGCNEGAVPSVLVDHLVLKALSVLKANSDHRVGSDRKVTVMVAPVVGVAFSDAVM